MEVLNMDSMEMTLTGFSVAQLPDMQSGNLFSALSGLDWIPAQPGRAIQYDLMESGHLENPYSGYEAAKKSTYVPQSDWVYRTSFDLAPDMVYASNLFIEFDCIDTFADVFVNNILVGTCDNMFIPWSFDISQADLREKANLLVVHIKAHGRMVADRADEAEKRIGCDGRAPGWARERSLVRRYQRSYAEDFCHTGQGIWGIGIVRPVKIRAFPEVYIKEYDFVVTSVGLPQCTRTTAVVHIEANGTKFNGRLTAKAVLFHQDGSIASQSEITLQDGVGTIQLDIASPKLWWPHGYGEQYLYTLNLSLLDSSGELHCCYTGSRP